MSPRLVLWLCWMANRLMDLAERIQGPRRVVELDGATERPVCAREEYAAVLTPAETRWLMLGMKIHLARRNQSERA